MEQSNNSKFTTYLNKYCVKSNANKQTCTVHQCNINQQQIYICMKNFVLYPDKTYYILYFLWY